MKSRKEKQRIRILDSLREKVPLSTNRGTFDRSIQRRPTKKQRRHSGRVYPKIFASKIIR